MSDDTRTVTWKDGARWSAGAGAYERLAGRLEGLRDTVVGLGPVLDRWRAQAAGGRAVDVDDFAPTEDDRAVFTAALSRVVEDGAADATEEGRAAQAGAKALHELFMTDVTKG